MTLYSTLERAVSAAKIVLRVGGKVHGFKRVNGRWTFSAKY